MRVELSRDEIRTAILEYLAREHRVSFDEPSVVFANKGDANLLIAIIDEKEIPF